jgi:hypothetical protein
MDKTFKTVLLPGRGPYLYSEVTFEGDTLVVGPYTYYPFPRLGLRIYVQPNTSMVIISSDNECIVLGEGYQEILDFPWGRYQAYFVSTRKGYFPLSEIRSLSADSLEIRLSVDIYWKVTKPEVLVGVREPIEQFIASCEGGIAMAIRENCHEAIIGTTLNAGRPMKDLYHQIWRRIGGLQNQCGIAVAKFNIRSIYGVPEITEKAKDYITTQVGQKVIAAIGENRKIEKEYEFIAESIHQRMMALGVARDNLAQEPERLQERVTCAIREIAQMVNIPMRNTGIGNSSSQSLLIGLDPAFAKAMEHAADTIRDLALATTLPKETVAILDDLLKTTMASSKGNGHNRGLKPIVESFLPALDQAKRPLSDESVAG